jgi:hypothetical protein
LLESKLDDILDQVDEKAYTTAYLDFFQRLFNLIMINLMSLKIALMDNNNLALVLYEGGMRLSFYNLTANQREVAEKLVISQGFYFKESH